MNPAAWTDADQITTGLQQAAEALERLSHVFAKRRRRGRKKPRAARRRKSKVRDSGGRVPTPMRPTDLTTPNPDADESSSLE